MAIKKRNKKSNKKSNNNKYNNKQKNNNQRNGKQITDKNGHNSDDQSIDVSLNSRTINAKKSENRSTKVDVFGDSDKRLDLKTIENNTTTTPTTAQTTIVAEEVSSNSKFNSCFTYSSPKGLANLGNTCYLNSVLQIISETQLLFDVLNERSNEGYIYRALSLKSVNDWLPDQPFDEELEIMLGQCMPLTQSLIGFMREMRSNNSRTISPTKVLREIRKEWTQFDGWAQQDSHELLRCLLDSLKCKEVIRQKRAILTDFKTTYQMSDHNNMSDDTKARIKSFATFAHLTPIDSVFGGQLLSSVCCNVCLYTNLIFEPFFDLSLPLTHLTNSSNNNNNSVVVEKTKSKLKDKNTTTADGQQEGVKCLLEEDVKNLTPKERKQKRQQKKAAKREAKEQKKILIQTDTKPFFCDTKHEINNCAENGNKTNECEEWVEDSNGAVEEGVGAEEANGKSDTEENLIEEQKGLEEENSSPMEDLFIEPLLDDFEGPELFGSCLVTIERSVDKTEDKDRTVGDLDDEEVFGIDLLYDNNEDNNEWNGKMTEDGWNDYYEEGHVFGPNPMIGCPNWHEMKPNFDTELSATDLADEDLNGSDECKAQELDLELFKLNICDSVKQELKESTNTTDSEQTQTSDSQPMFDSNSETIKQIIAMSLETISDNQREKLPNFDLIRNLLSNFTSIESLSGNNKYLCEMCTKTNGSGQKVFTNASKRALIAVPPPVLTLHLKRFEAEGYRRAVNLKKISTFVSYPATFDLSPFVSKMYNHLQPITGHQKTNALIYSLYGVVEHSGTLRSGHYTAYVKLRPMAANRKKFAILMPFMPKVDNILKMIENKFFNTNESTNEENNCLTNGTTNGFHSPATNGSNTTTDCDDNSEEDGVDSSSDCGKWFHISDSSVTSSSLGAVLRSHAYILFYERIV